ncbi:MAG: hypothetical protein AAFU64_06005 [Bacteroidota bacterium]
MLKKNLVFLLIGFNLLIFLVHFLYRYPRRIKPVKPLALKGFHQILQNQSIRVLGEALIPEADTALYFVRKDHQLSNHLNFQIEQRLSFPEEAVKKDWKGKVYVQFLHSPEGKIQAARILPEYKVLRPQQEIWCKEKRPSSTPPFNPPDNQIFEQEVKQVLERLQIPLADQAEVVINSRTLVIYFAYE